MLSRKVFFCAFLLVCLTVSSEAIECYTCDSLSQPNCLLNKFKSNGISKVFCPTEVCFIFHYTADGGMSATQRGCSMGDAANKLIGLDTCPFLETMIRRAIPSELQFSVKNCEECRTNLCNSAPAQFAGYVVPLVLLALGIFAL